MAMLKKYKISIFGDSYSIVSDEREEHIAQSVQLLDSLVREVADKMQAVEPHRSTMLVALKLASQVLTLKAEIERNKQEQERLIQLLDKELSY